ncbi:DUF86 domain-containing protein [Gloeocapsa sp. PCC 73106]|uniref:HepT-like ribonuclease domain-containing protein n=1 Tax=Gloeocapsa sp. PCC 73106 TaxID=102232 RepID=UPI0002AC34F6|nr:DUF86 domain-containing protein [Gloeocapsa sp. PCC 73106]ELS00046.1 hypothetical protein GLO73106DRAFT_00038990 [Gloeocapsa sp. PCC 73106]
MSRSLQLYLEDIVMSGVKILRYTQGMRIEDFVRDEKTYDAVVRNLQIIGEAVKSIPLTVRNKYPEIEWRKIAGLRDILAHAYFSLEDETLWDIIENKISPLIKQVELILLELKRDLKTSTAILQVRSQR